jgi:hypothetical protein
MHPHMYTIEHTNLHVHQTNTHTHTHTHTLPPAYDLPGSQVVSDHHLPRPLLVRTGHCMSVAREVRDSKYWGPFPQLNGVDINRA